MQEQITKTSWPRNIVKSVDCRKRDLVIRITNWTDDKDEPSYDVEIYDKGVYDWNLSESFCTKNAKRTDAQAKRLAISFASKRIKELL